MSLVCVVCFLPLASIGFAQLYLVPAGPDTSQGKIITSNDNVVCDEEFPNGLTIRCDGNGSATKATFFVNNRRTHMEHVVPFFIGGNAKGVAWEWDHPIGTAHVVCNLDNGEKWSEKITFACLGIHESPQTSYMPSMEFVWSTPMVELSVEALPAISFPTRPPTISPSSYLSASQSVVPTTTTDVSLETVTPVPNANPVPKPTVPFMASTSASSTPTKSPAVSTSPPHTKTPTPRPTPSPVAIRHQVLCQVQNA